MANSNIRYYIRMAGNEPILQSVVARTRMPKGGVWRDITVAIGNCCVYDPNAIEAPATFTATPGATGVINLAWAAVDGANNYRLERATNSTFTTALTQIYYGTGLSYSNTGLNTGTTYYFRVTAIADKTSTFSTTSAVAP